MISLILDVFLQRITTKRNKNRLKNAFHDKTGQKQVKKQVKIIIFLHKNNVQGRLLPQERKKTFERQDDASLNIIVIYVKTENDSSQP